MKKGEINMEFVYHQQGLTYTLEAILGIFLIIGTMIFLTGNIPYTAQKTGEHSKVQLVHIGRDVLDLISLTPITDIFSNYSRSQGVYRQYLLVTDKTFVAPGENVNFTVYYLDTNTIVNKTLTLEQTVLGLKTPIGTRSINGSLTWNFSSTGDYNFRVYEGSDPDNPISWSNYVTLTVGYYFLYTDISGISESGSKIVDGVVYDANYSEVPGMNVQILDYKYDVLNNSAAITTSKRTLEDFENTGYWTSNKNLTLNTTHTSGNYSISINDSSSFWIKKVNTTGYQLLRYDNLSFDFYSNTMNENIDVELSKNNTLNKFIWRNISIQNIGWNRINIPLRNPEIISGSLTSQDIDTINISVSNIDNNNYLIDNLITSGGSFSFIWPIISTGAYYINAADEFARSSNKHRIVFSKTAGSIGFIYSLEDTIYETETTKIILLPKGNANLNPISGFKVNLEKYKAGCYDINKIGMTFDSGDPTSRTVNFTGYVAGDYYIFYGETGGGCGEGPGVDPANGAKTNAIVIHVLPFQNTCLFGDCNPRCSGLNMTELSMYLKNFVPPYVNYNMYLINPDGTKCEDCPEFKEIINGYPTDEAVTVNKIFRLKNLNGEYLRELRIILWYK